jgi:hypothetical protein
MWPTGWLQSACEFRSAVDCGTGEADNRQHTQCCSSWRVAFDAPHVRLQGGFGWPQASGVPAETDRAVDQRVGYMRWAPICSVIILRLLKKPDPRHQQQVG